MQMLKTSREWITSMSIKISQSSTDETNYVRKKLIEYNSQNTSSGIYEEVNLCVKDNHNNIIAGINSAICWNWLEIDILWVDDGYRKQGYGSKLLNEIERIAISKNCTFIKLNTFSFQAPEFYKKHGYKVLAVIDNAPIRSKHYFLKKDLEIDVSKS